MPGHKIKSVSCSGLARSHDVGSTVTLAQPAVHSKYGTFIFPVLSHSDFYKKAAESNLEEARKLFDRIIELPVGGQNVRSIFDHELLASFFLHSQLVVIFSYLWLEYFAMECARAFDKLEAWNDERLDQKIKFLILRELGMPRLPDDLCAAFGELENRRHALNHPKFNNIVNGLDTEWDTVHVAWLLAGNFETSFKNAFQIHAYLYEPFIAEMRKRPTGPISLTDIKRGLRFENQVKKKK